MTSIGLLGSLLLSLKTERAIRAVHLFGCKQAVDASVISYVSAEY